MHTQSAARQRSRDRYRLDLFFVSNPLHSLWARRVHCVGRTFFFLDVVKFHLQGTNGPILATRKDESSGRKSILRRVPPARPSRRRRSFPRLSLAVHTRPCVFAFRSHFVVVSLSALSANAALDDARRAAFAAQHSAGVLDRRAAALTLRRKTAACCRRRRKKNLGWSPACSFSALCRSAAHTSKEALEGRQHANRREGLNTLQIKASCIQSSALCAHFAKRRTHVNNRCMHTRTTQ